MRFTNMLSGLLLAPVVAAAAGRPVIAMKPASCNNQDDCARAVAGTDGSLQPSSIRRADCTSALSITVTPIIYSTKTVYTSTSTDLSTATSTIALTTTTTTTFTTNSVMMKLTKRADAPAPSLTSKSGTVPAYASTCSNVAAYISACGCFGNMPSTTITAPALTSTITVSAATTKSSTTFLTVTVTQVSTVTTTSMMLGRGMITFPIE